MLGWGTWKDYCLAAGVLGGAVMCDLPIRVVRLLAGALKRRPKFSVEHFESLGM